MASNESLLSLMSMTIMSLQDINLWRGQANTGRGVHGFTHIVDEFPNAAVYLRNRSCFAVESRIWID